MNFKFFKEKDNEDPFIYTEDQLMARLRFFIGICLALTLTGIVFVVLYSIIFVTQPLNAISPIDQKFFELIIPIATFLTGTLSGIMLAGNDKDAKMKALEAATRPTPVSPSPTSPAPTSFGPKPFAPAPMTPSFNAPASPFASAPMPTGPVTTGFGGKLAPPPAFEPEL
jgi:hypothetical protein